MATIEQLFEQTQSTVEQVAKQSGLALERVEAIATGRWLPSPTERTCIAQAFGVEVESVDWGHTMSPRVIRYFRYGLKEKF